MNLVLPIRTARLRHYTVILWILLSWPVCSLAHSKRAGSEVHQNDPAPGGMHVDSVSPAARPSRQGDRRADIKPRPEHRRAGRVNPVSPVAPPGVRVMLGGARYLIPHKGYQLSGVLLYRFSRYQAGAGAALDLYTDRTIPVFGHFSADLDGRVTTPFVYLDPGVSFPWLRKREYPYDKKPDRGLPGVYLNAGIGQRLWLSPGHSAQLSLGYCLETFRLRNRYPNPNGSGKPGWDTYKYVFNRLVLRLGVTL